MKISDDPNDPFADELRDEAKVERPPFSPGLHDRIIDRIGQERLRIPSPGAMRKRWIPFAAAAAIVLGCGAAAFWAGRPYFVSKPKPPMLIATNMTADPVDSPVFPAHLSDFSANVGGFLTATLWPPEIHVRLPIAQPLVKPAAETTTEVAAEPKPLPGSPEWLLATLEQPTLDAKAVLTDLMPPELRMLVEMAKRN